jgi:hypothetical protein
MRTRHDRSERSPFWASSRSSFAKRGLIIAKGKVGKEVAYENPQGYGLPDYLVDDILLDLVSWL